MSPWRRVRPGDDPLDDFGAVLISEIATNLVESRLAPDAPF